MRTDESAGVWYLIMLAGFMILAFCNPA